MKKSRIIACTAAIVGMSVAIRISKNLITTIQFVNIPLVFTIVGATMLGWLYGLLIGILSFVVSDILLGLGPWTIFTSTTCGLIGALWGLFFRKVNDSLLVFLTVFLLTLTYDIFTSWILYVIFGIEPMKAIIISIVGLFLPIMGGFMIGVGPITEASTAFLTTIFLKGLKSRRLVR